MGTYHKLFSTREELKEGVSPGPKEQPVVKMDFSTVGTQICYDIQWGEGGGLTGPVVGRGGKLYDASTVNPFFCCADASGSGGGTTTCHLRLRMGAKVEESTPAVYDGLAFILNSDAYLYAIE